MLVLLIVHLAVALLAPLLVRWSGPRAFYLLALAPAAAFAWAVTATGAARDGGTMGRYPWVPRMGLDLSLRLSTLSWLMVLLVGGVGALVLVYCARYFDPAEPGLGRFAAVFVGFAGAMLGLVLADNLILLYTFWELTTVCSFLLIGHRADKRASRRAANQAFVVTTGGGLALLVGIVMLGQQAGTYRVSELAAAPLQPGWYLATAVALILVGALAKSAILPVSFWLPAAMTAPTPVSAYLHAAAMVKAGVYLVALLTPVVDVNFWRPVTFVAGGATMLAAGWAALCQNDLKLLLAYGTVSELGLLLVLAGAGTYDAALADTIILLSHALFKAALFLVVGIVDRCAGSRNLAVLSGLWRRMPLVFAVAVVAAGSMAGVPLTVGFVAKEAVFWAFADAPIVLATMAVGLTFATSYSIRFVWGAFADKPDRTPTQTRPVAVAMLVPVGLLAVASLAAGLLAAPLDRLLAGYPELFGRSGHHLAIWHGLTPELALSVLVLAGGGLLFALRRQIAPLVARLRSPVNGARAYERLTRRLDRLAIEVTGATQRGSLPQYLGTILVLLVVVLGGALLVGAPWPDRVMLWYTPLQATISAVLVAAAVLAAWTRRRLTAVVLVSVTGYSIALIAILYGAPDVALTQFLVETFTIVAFVLVLRRLPANFSARPLRRSRWARTGIGLAVGLVMSGLALATAGARRAAPISLDYPNLAVYIGSGRNVLNVALVDIRAWDTLGEISVLMVAATGVVSLLFQWPSRRLRPRRLPLISPVPGFPVSWLRAAPLPGTVSRTVVFEAVTRLLFHTMVLFSVFLMFAGHNAPGGGFIGGLVAGLALTVRYLAGGRIELDEAAPVDAGLVLGTGLFISVATGLAGLVIAGAALRSFTLDFHLPLVGDVHLVTSIFFDIGVYLIVVGLALDILRSLGGEVDRQIEAELGGQPQRQPDEEPP